MDILYTTETALTWEEYKKFFLRVTKKGRIFTIIWSIIMLLSACSSLMTKLYLHGAIVLVLVMLLWVLEYVKINISAKKVFDKNAVMQKPTTLNFYADRLEEVSENGTVCFAYADVIKIYETKTNFYIMIARNRGLVVIKENCPEGLCEFLGEMK